MQPGQPPPGGPLSPSYPPPYTGAPTNPQPLRPGPPPPSYRAQGPPGVPAGAPAGGFSGATNGPLQGPQAPPLSGPPTGPPPGLGPPGPAGPPFALPSQPHGVPGTISASRQQFAAPPAPRSAPLPPGAAAAYADYSPATLVPPPAAGGPLRPAFPGSIPGGLVGGPPPSGPPGSGPSFRAPPPFAGSLSPPPLAGPPRAFAPPGPPGAPPPPGTGAEAYHYQQQPPPPPQQQQQQQWGAPPPSPYGGAAPPPPPGAAGAGRGYGAADFGQVAEEFESLTLAAVPGSLDAGVDVSTLPRPLPLPAGKEEAPNGGAPPGSAHPRFVSMTVKAMPQAQSLRAKWQLPLGAIIQPLAETPPGEEVPVVDFGRAGIVRCRRCRTYINPYVEFTDGGRRWRCNVCGLLNEVPSDYYCQLDASGRRLDADSRPELTSGSVEFVAYTEYMVRPPMPPAYFFLIDVSAAAAASGVLQVISDTARACLDKLPGDSRTQVGVLTFDSALHFYNLKAGLRQPQMMVVADLDEPFVPLPDELLVNLGESRAVVEALLESLPAMFRGSANVESALGPALKATYMILSQYGGKLLLFQSTLPSLGVGRLKLRGQDARAYGTEREHLLRVTEEAFFKSTAAECSRVHIGVSVYAFASGYTDLASLGTLAKYTGGQVYYYPGFQLARDGDKFSSELARDLTRETGWEGIMRIRCGKGLKIATYHGHFFVRSIDLVALPAVDCDKAVAVQIQHEDTLLTSQTVYFQAALLYTSSVGERRIRVHTVALPVVASLGELYRAADGGATAALLTKLAVERSLQAKLDDARQMVQQRVAAGLREFRGLLPAPHRGGGRLALPPPLRLLPLYALAACKCPALRGGFAEAPPDARSAAGFEVMNMSAARLLRLLYPALFRLDTMAPECGKPGGGGGGGVLLPPALPLTQESLDGSGAYLLDDGVAILIWLGKGLPQEWLAQLLGPERLNDPALSQRDFVPHGSELGKRVGGIMDELRRGGALYQQAIAVRQGEPLEARLAASLVEDRSPWAPAYAEFVVQLHRQVQQKGP